MRRSVVPPYLLAHLAQLGDPAMAAAAEAARRSLVIDAPFRSVRVGETPPPTARPGASRPPGARSDEPDRTIHDARGREVLPGEVVRREGEPGGDDRAVDEAYEGLGATHRLFREVYDRSSIDGEGLPLLGTVHYGRDYDNAFWDGQQMVFGDGDGVVFRRFTSSLSVIGHELAHGVTQYTANLAYQGQSGALNESVSDVFGALVEQYALGQTTEQATWLIGVGLFTDEVEGSALRSMKAPGTAYDDDVLGRDPQPASMADYIETTDDNGGVHLNSGIPNRAFHLTAAALGGTAWDRAGLIWYDTLTAGSIRADSDFAEFAGATSDAALVRFGDDSAEHRAVLEAWSTVGVDIP